PLITYAHSAALACQCSSRSPPGASCISTPASFSETGNSATVASLAQPPSQVFGVTLPNSKRNEGSCAPASTGGVGPNGGCPSAEPSVAAAAAASAPPAAPSTCRRENSAMGSSPCAVPSPQSMRRGTRERTRCQGSGDSAALR